MIGRIKSFFRFLSVRGISIMLMRRIMVTMLAIIGAGRILAFLGLEESKIDDGIKIIIICATYFAVQVLCSTSLKEYKLTDAESKYVYDYE